MQGELKIPSMVSGGWRSTSKATPTQTHSSNHESYSASKITSLKGSCPVCNGERNDCRASGDLIHCYSHNEPPLNYEFKSISAIGASLYAPVKNSTFSSSRTYTQKRSNQDHPLHSITKEKEVEGDPVLPSLEERDRTIRSYPRSITKKQNADLLRRGLAQDEIDFAVSEGWLFGLKGGYGVAAYDPVSGLLVGAQRANDDRSKKYTWGVFTGKNKLIETGENPLFVWVSPDFDSSNPYEIKYSEGSPKSLIRAFFEWHTNTQIIVIGAAGGIFGAKSLKRVLIAFPDATSHTLLCDADTQNAKKLNIDRAYRNLANDVPSIKFANWGQWQDKSKHDCDETYGTDDFNNYQLAEPSGFLNFFNKLRAEKEKTKLFAYWELNKLFTPDVRLDTSEVFTGIPIPPVNTILGVKSDWGTQKTRGMMPHLTHWQSLGYGVILGGYRNALLSQTVEVWKDVLTSFTMMNADPLYIRMAGCHIALCLDQLTRKKCSPQNLNNRILVLDESDAVEIHLLMSGTLDKNRSEVYALFCEAVRRADVIYLMSAGLSDATINFIADIRGDRDTKIIKYQNDFVNPQKFVIVEDVVKVSPNGITEICNRSILRTKFLTFKGKACVVSDSQNDLKALELESQRRGFVTFRYDRETSGTELGKEFAKDPDLFILKYKIEHLFISPSGNSGISIRIENYFKTVFGFYFGVIDVDSFLQMPMRIRDLNVIRYISVPSSIETGYGEAIPKKFPEQIEKAVDEFTQDFGLLSLQNLPVQDCLEKLYKTLSDLALNDLQFKRFAQLQASHNFEKANLKLCLEKRLNTLGHTFTRLEDGDSISGLIGALLATKEEVKLDECTKIHDAADITFEAAQKLQKTEECGYEDRLKIEKAFIKETLPKIDKAEVWSPEFLKRTKYDDRQFLKKLDIRFLAANPAIAKSKAVDRMAYLLSSSDNIAPQDIKSPLPLLKGLEDVRALELAEYKGDDLHNEHELIVDVCKRSGTKTNIRRIGIKQGKEESNMQFAGRVLGKIGKGTGKAKYCKETKKRFYAIADKSRQEIEKWQFNRAFKMLGLSVYKLPSDLFDKCMGGKDGELEIKTLADFYEKFPDLTPIIKLAYGKAQNLDHLALIHTQLKLIFESVDNAFLDITEAIETRYRNYQMNKKIHDFERILSKKNSALTTTEIVIETCLDVDHPPHSTIKEKEVEGDPDFVLVNSPIVPALTQPPKINAMVTLLDGVTGFIHQIEIGGWYLIGRLSDVSQGVGRWAQLQDIAAIAYV